MRQVPTGWKMVVPILPAASNSSFALQGWARQVFHGLERGQGRGLDDAPGQADGIGSHAQVFRG
jgi:hypothetical protein